MINKPPTCEAFFLVMKDSHWCGVVMILCLALELTENTISKYTHLAKKSLPIPPLLHHVLHGPELSGMDCQLHTSQASVSSQKKRHRSHVISEVTRLIEILTHCRLLSLPTLSHVRHRNGLYEAREVIKWARYRPRRDVSMTTFL